MITETLSLPGDLNQILVTVNYNEPEAIARAIEAAGLNTEHVELSLEEISLAHLGKVAQKVGTVPLKQRVPNCFLPEALLQHGKKLIPKKYLHLADPLTALLYYVGKRTEQIDALATIFTTIGGRLFVLYVYERDGKRVLRIRETEPNKFCGDVSFVCDVV